MTDQDYEPDKPLTRDQILKAKNEPEVIQLPSGKTVQAAYLSWGMVNEIEKSIGPVSEEEKGHKFTEKVVEWMLRESDKKDYRAFSKEDQSCLVEIAVDVWGCKDEYEQLTYINDPEVRFFQAVQRQNKELAKQLSESASAISANLASTIDPLKSLQIELASSLKGMLDQFSVINSLEELASTFNTPVVEQMRDISRFQSPILGIAEEIAKLQPYSVLSAKNALLESVEGTISSYQNLMLDVLPLERFASLPDSVRYFPTIEMRNTSIVAAQFVEETTNEPQEDIIVPEISVLLRWLENLDPSFPKMLLGAEKTIYSQNPDHCRHFASSHRELSTHLLHLLAPDNDVRQWTNDPNHFDKDGKPTRRARLKFIARNHNNGTFVDFVIKDFENQMALLNADEHRKTQEYSVQELAALHKRFLSMLGFFREIVTSHS